MKLRFVCRLILGVALSLANLVFAQQTLSVTEVPDSAQRAAPTGDASSSGSPQQATGTPPQMADASPPKHTLGPLDISVNWRTRAEAGTGSKVRRKITITASGIPCCGSASVKAGNTSIGSSKANNRPSSVCRTTL